MLFRSLHLEYGGAVDPTSYLLHWQRVARVHVPVPVHPRFPAGAVGAQTSFVWRELLLARGLIRPPRHPVKRPPVAVPPLARVTIAAQVEPSPARPRHGWNAVLLALLLGAAGPIGLAGVLLARRLRG